MGSDATGYGCAVHPESTFSAELHTRGQHAVLDVHGEIDGSTIESLQTAALQAMADHDSLVLRMCNVTFIDSAGLRSLIVLKRSSDRDAKALVLEQPSRVVVRLLELTALDAHFTISNDESMGD